MSGGSAGTRHSFASPPVVEVAIGIEFLPPEGLGVVALARAADAFSADFPVVHEMPGTPPNAPPGTDQPAGIVLHLSAPPTRLWLLTEDERMLLQLQNDRLILNWRRDPEGTADYPRYPVLKDLFLQHWASFVDHLAARGVPTPRATALELTYINVVDDTVRPGHPSPYTALIDLGPVGQARYRTTFQHVAQWTTDDAARELVVSSTPFSETGASFTLTCRSAADESVDADSITRVLDESHEALTLQFRALTTDAAQESWGRSS